MDACYTLEVRYRIGIAQGLDNYILSKIVPVDIGINRILLRSTTKAGAVKLRASAEDLESVSVTLNSKAFSVDFGLSTYIPSSDLSIDLFRGPTPKGSLYTPSRNALTVMSVSATNSTIKYELSDTFDISQVVLKLGDFRTKQYPSTVKADDTEV